MSRPLHIALIGDYALSDANAPGSRMLWLARALAERGINVTVGGVAAEPVSVEGVKVVTVGGAPKGGAFSRLLFHHLAALKLLAQKPLRQADVLWVRGPVVTPLFGLLARLTGKRLVWDFHGFLHMEQTADRSSPVRRVTAAYTWLLERLSVALADTVTAAGEGHRWLMADKFPQKKCLTLPNGVSIAAFPTRKSSKRGAALRKEAGIKADEPVVLFVGRNQAYWWTDAFRHVANGLSSGRMVVIGEGYPPSSGGEISAPLYLGSLPHSAVVEWLCHVADVAICPYRHDWVNANTPEFLASARKLMEYAAAGLPVVLPDIPARPGFLVPEEHCLLYRPGDADDLSAQVRRLLADASLRKKMGVAGRKLAKRFEWGRLLDDSGLVAWLNTTQK